MGYIPAIPDQSGEPARAFGRDDPFGAKLIAIFSSDVGHFDVVDIGHPVPEADKLVEDGPIARRMISATSPSPSAGPGQLRHASRVALVLMAQIMPSGTPPYAAEKRIYNNPDFAHEASLADA